MNDEQAIRNTIQTYFDGAYESDAGKIRAAFHPSAKITGYLEDELHEMSLDDFAGFVADQQPRKLAIGPGGCRVSQRDLNGRRVILPIERPGA